MNATAPEEKGELELLVDKVLGKEQKWRRLTAVMYVLPFLLVIAGAAYSGYLISEAEAKKAAIQNEIKLMEEDAKLLNIEIAQKNAEIEKQDSKLKAIGSITPQLPIQEQESINAIIQASDSPSKDLQAFVVISSLSSLDRARATARRFTSQTRHEATIYKTPKGVFAVTFGTATTPEEAKARLDQAKNALGRKDAYIRYAVDWIIQTG